MKNKILKYLVAAFLLGVFMSASWGPLLTSSPNDDEWLSLQKIKTEKESGSSEKSGETQWREYFSPEDNFTLLRSIADLTSHKHFLRNISVKQALSLPVITPPPDPAQVVLF